MIKILFLSVSILLVACNHPQRNHDKETTTQQAGKMYVEVEPFRGDSGWGYNIYVDKRLYISQSIIPGVPGAKGFKTRDDALIVGTLAVTKMSTYRKRPLITQQDLSRLHININ